jgi:glycosyltransferase involved in cell wall biosynthesis
MLIRLRFWWFILECRMMRQVLVRRGEPMGCERILAIVPAYNEADSLPHVVRDLRSVGLPLDIVVIDDGSQDETSAVARQLGVAVVTLPFNLGIGGAHQTGFQYAVTWGYACAVQFDGDGQHLAREIPALLKPLEAGIADVVVGSRFAIKGHGYRQGSARRIGSITLAGLVRLLGGHPYTDVTSGFRALNARALHVAAADYPQDFPEPESFLTFRRYRIRVAEVHTEMQGRVGGVSSIHLWRSVYYMVKVTLALCIERLRAPLRGV